MNTLTAKLNREFAWRMTAIIILLLAICAWSIYDGRIGWPQENAALDKVRPTLLATNLTAEAWLNSDGKSPSLLQKAFLDAGVTAPESYIRKVGEYRLSDADTDRREEKRAFLAMQLRLFFAQPVHSRIDLMTQDFQAVLCLTLAVIMAITLLGISKKDYKLENGILSGSGVGAELKLTDIISVDWKRWKRKGIVVLTTADGRKIKLDAWHHKGMTAIITAIAEARPELKTNEAVF
jgi:hypothetical protein